MREKSQQGERAMALFLVFWALLFGGLARLAPAMGNVMPVNDGGLFYSMAQDIRDAGFSLPEFASFNQAGIPFAYPPLALYLAAFGEALVPLLQIVRWLPPIVSVITILAFYLLSRALLKSELQAGLATVAFALMPAAYDLTISGGGVTRSFGLFFSICTLYYLYRMFSKPRLREVLLTAVMTSFLVLSHPVAAVHTVLSALVFWWFFGRNRQSTRNALGVVALTLLFTAPWWLTVVTRHGIDPYLNAFQSGVDRLVFLMPLLRLDLGSEIFLDFISVLAMLGLIRCIVRREYFLPLWILMIFVVGRDAQTATALPVALAASLGITDVIFSGLRTLERNFKSGGQPLNAVPESDFQTWFESNRGPKLIIGFFLIYSVFNVLAYTFSISIHVTDAEQKAIEWVNQNTPTDTRFLVLTLGDPLNTPLQEWFPVLTKRVNLMVVQGYEWLPGQQFAQRLDDYKLLQPCFTENWSCVADFAAARNFEFDYVYVYQGYVGREEISPTEPKLAGWLLQDLYASPDFVPIYEQGFISIFQVVK